MGKELNLPQKTTQERLIKKLKIQNCIFPYHAIRMAAESNGMEVAATINISVHCSKYQIMTTKVSQLSFHIMI